MVGYHAGDRVWVVYQTASGQPYCFNLFSISVARRENSTVSYKIEELNNWVSSSRVVPSSGEAACLCEKLNKGR